MCSTVEHVIKSGVNSEIYIITRIETINQHVAFMIVNISVCID